MERRGTVTPPILVDDPTEHLSQLLWLEMALFTLAKKHYTIQKNIHNSAKKGFESLGSGVIIPGKNFVFDLGVAHGDPIFAQVGLKNNF